MATERMRRVSWAGFAAMQGIKRLDRLGTREIAELAEIVILAVIRLCRRWNRATDCGWPAAKMPFTVARSRPAYSLAERNIT
jgi:hypothetical protein